MNNLDKNITIGPEWFATIKKDYACWRHAWIREAAQNSLDAGATRIDITTSYDCETGQSCIVWSDNGCGMDIETLENKFMAVGGSKKNKNSTGGFGVAKLILAFSQASYEIRTQDIHVKGCGAKYSVECGLPFVEGMVLTVYMDGEEKSILDHRAAKWVRFTTTKCEIYLNNIKLESLQPNIARAHTAWCSIYTYDDIKVYTSYIRVRINGQFMFEIYTSHDCHILVDLVETESAKCLTSNRDGMNWDYRDKLNKLIEELYDDPSKIKGIEGHVVIYRGNLGRIKFGKEEEYDAPKVSLAPLSSSAALTAAPIKGQLCAPASPPGKSSFKKTKELIDGFDIVVLNKTSKEIPAHLIPGTMNNSSYKVLNRWIRIIQTVGEIMGRTESVSIGWVIDLQSRALCRYAPEHGTMLLVNPVCVTDDKFRPYWRNDISGFYEMVSTAVHEIAHMDHPNHAAQFAETFTVGSAKVMARINTLESLRKETK